MLGSVLSHSDLLLLPPLLRNPEAFLGISGFGEALSISGFGEARPFLDISGLEVRPFLSSEKLAWVRRSPGFGGKLAWVQINRFRVHCLGSEMI